MQTQAKYCWTTREQEYLLKAALLKGQASIDAWQNWRRCINLDDIDYGSLRLLPLLYSNLQSQSVTDSDMTRYKGIFRRYWLNNQLLINRAIPVLSAFRDAGIDSMLFKGMGLIINNRPNYGVRPMEDIDILIHKEDIKQAIDIMHKIGWHEQIPITEETFFLWHAIAWQRKEGGKIDLHWYTLAYEMTGQFEPVYWERSYSSAIENIPVRVMDNTDQLIHTIMHGLAWNPIPPVRWIADAMMLLHNSDRPVEWDYLVQHAFDRHFTLTMSQGFRYLKQKFDAAVPDQVLHSLAHAPVSLRERQLYYLRTHKPPAGFGGLRFYLIRYWTYPKGTFAPPGFSRYLQKWWGVKHLWQMPFAVISHFWGIIITLLSKKTAHPKEFGSPGT